MSIKKKIFPPLNVTSSSDILPRFPEVTGIPRIVHQTFYNAQLPEALQKNVEQIKALNPGWEYRFYDDAAVVDFIAKNYPPIILQYFERIDPRYGAARADLFRYLLMYKVGGVYLDIKSTVTRPLDAVLRPDDSFLLSQWNNEVSDYDVYGKHYELRDFGGREFQQWYLVSAPGHAFMRAVIANVLGNIDAYIPGYHGTGKPGVLRVTGPIAYSLAIHKLLNSAPHRIVDSQQDLGFEYNIIQNNAHKTTFKSHYSLQTHSLIRLDFPKKHTTHLYSLAQRVHDLLVRKNLPAKSV